ncbi:MAG: ExeA family protein [Gammaproteobacteria bacterium]
MTGVFEALATDHLRASRARTDLENRLGDLMQQGGIALVTGEAGAGKTAAVRAFVRSLDAGRFLTVALVPPLNNARALLRALLSALGESPQWATPDALAQLERIIMPWHEQQRVLVLVVDEAQELATTVLLFLRSLLHTPIGDRLPVRIILIGTPALAARLRVQAMEAIAQRVATRVQVLGFTRDETKAYLEEGAAALRMTITDDAAELVFQRSRAIPRVVATLARLSAERAKQSGATSIGSEHVAVALEEADLR